MNRRLGEMLYEKLPPSIFVCVCVCVDEVDSVLVIRRFTLE